MKRHVAHNAHIEWSQVSFFATSGLSEAETFCATLDILLLHVVGSISTEIALTALNVLLTETSFVLLIADFQSCSSKIAATGLAVWEVEESISTLVAAPTNDIGAANARAVVEIALKVSEVNS